MGNAISSLIGEGGAGAAGLEEEGEENILLSEEHSLILTCCWVTLKVEAKKHVLFCLWLSSHSLKLILLKLLMMIRIIRILLITAAGALQCVCLFSCIGSGDFSGLPGGEKSISTM